MPKAITVLRLRARGNNLATASRLALDGTKKNCYTAVYDGKTELFLSSSPSVINLQQFFFVLSRVADVCHNL